MNIQQDPARRIIEGLRRRVVEANKCKNETWEHGAMSATLFADAAAILESQEDLIPAQFSRITELESVIAEQKARIEELERHLERSGYDY